jgi:SAM-dependent methyltransferase
MIEGWRGWDDYAPFYDWENARTVGRRDVRFWCDLARRRGGRVLELGCGTGRILAPLARHAPALAGIDRSAPMLARARRRLRSAPVSVPLIRGDITALPFRDGAFDLVVAPYGVLQSLTRERDLRATLAGVHAALGPGGLFGIDLVPDLPQWSEYSRRASLSGRRGRDSRITLIESVRQDRRRRLTIFDQEFVERRGRARAVRRFTLTFRTLSVPQMVRRLERSGFHIRAVLGDYDGRPWDERAEVWLILADRSSVPRPWSSVPGS